MRRGRLEKDRAGTFVLQKFSLCRRKSTFFPVKTAIGRKLRYMGTLHAERGGRRAAAITLFFLFSFLGWLMEKLWFLFAYGLNVDRGFLTLPFCTVYGSALFFIRAVLGEPFRRDLSYPANALRFLLYAALAALIASAAELGTGLFFERVFGVRLWSYYDCPYNLFGYVCLPASVGWGFLIPVALQAIWFPLERAFARVNGPLLRAVNGVLACALLFDFILTAFA